MEKEKIINRFDKGMTNDPREKDTRYSQLIKNFDAHTYSKKLVPFRNSESGDSAPTTSQKQAFCIGYTGSTYLFYALGRQSAVNRAEILKKDISVGDTVTDFDDNGWGTPSNNQAGQATPSFNLFVFYKKTGLIYGAHTGTHIFAFDPTGAAAFANTHQAITYTNIAQGLVHSKDDVLYIPYDNKIAKNDNGSWTAAALTLPSYFFITSICEYGSFLAIACQPLSGLGNSVVYLWDRDSTFAALSENIDWGEGNLQILEEIEGHLIGISYIAGLITAKIVFRQYSGGKSTIFKEFISEAAYSAGDLPIAKQKLNSCLYFILNITLNGTKQQGLWKIGRNTFNDPFSVVMDRAANNDTAIQNGANNIRGFILVKDYVFISYLDASGNFALSKTNDTATYTATSYYDTLIYNAGDSSKTKKLLGATVMTEYLPAAGQVVLKYKKDEETSFTAIFTNTTDNSIRYSAVLDASGNELPQYKEITFRIESTGGAVITGLKFKSKIIENDIYS